VRGPTHLSPTHLKIAFASGRPEQNRALVECLAAFRPELPLYVVAEFEPASGIWIPWHVYRPLGENLKAIRAETGTALIEAAYVALAPGTAYSAMRLAALRLAAGRLSAFDEEMRRVGVWGYPAYALRSREAERARARKWLSRIAHPGEAAVPVRARLAQARGIVASRFRAQAKERPMAGFAPLTPGVTVVVPSRDGRELLASLLPPLLPQIAHGEVIVVDNGSSDGTVEWLARDYPSVRAIQKEAPLSFARAVNAGIVEARFTRTLMLNNDMIVEPGFVAALDSAFDEVPDLYCATAQIFFPPGVRREETGKAVWRRENPLDFPVRCDDPHPGEDLTWVLYGSGGCSLFDTAKLRETGGISEVYDPAYVEDMDFGYRAWKRGWPSVFRAGAKAEHRHRATTSRFFTPRQLDFFVERNYLRFLIHAVGDAALFRALWSDAIRRLQLLAMNGNEAATDALRSVPHIGARPAPASGLLSEPEILALGNGDVACFPGRAARHSKTILIASPCLPFPLSHGGAVRIFNLMARAARDYSIVLLAFCDNLETPAHELLDICSEVVLVRRRGSHYRKNTPRPDMVEEFESDTFRACLKQAASRWRASIVQLEFTWMAQYAGVYTPAKTILVEHDITFDLKEQLLRTTGETGAALLEMRGQLEKWRTFETGAWRAADCVVAMSEKDARTARGARSVAVIPNGVDCQRFRPDAADPEPKRLLFVGSFAHLPNLLALDFFLREVWPRLTPGYRLHVIAGPRPDYFREFHRASVQVDLEQPGIECEAFVSDVREAYRRAEIVLAPLTASAGTNIKVPEAMAMGRVVVATPAGLNGLDLAPGEDVIRESDPAAMASAIEALCADPERRRRVERNARATAAGRYDWNAIAERQRSMYSGMI
jgi:GT2 family glycosyltransferase/glycosyltransferase involved in cell wall biosynthesis